MENQIDDLRGDLEDEIEELRQNLATSDLNMIDNIQFQENSFEKIYISMERMKRDLKLLGI